MWFIKSLIVCSIILLPNYFELLRLLFISSLNFRCQLIVSGSVLAENLADTHEFAGVNKRGK